MWPNSTKLSVQSKVIPPWSFETRQRSLLNVSVDIFYVFKIVLPIRLRAVVDNIFSTIIAFTNVGSFVSQLSDLRTPVSLFSDYPSSNRDIAAWKPEKVCELLLSYENEVTAKRIARLGLFSMVVFVNLDSNSFETVALFLKRSRPHRTSNFHARFFTAILAYSYESFRWFQFPKLFYKVNSRVNVLSVRVD